MVRVRDIVISFHRRARRGDGDGGHGAGVWREKDLVWTCPASEKGGFRRGGISIVSICILGAYICTNLRFCSLLFVGVVERNGNSA